MYIYLYIYIYLFICVWRVCIDASLYVLLYVHPRFCEVEWMRMRWKIQTAKKCAGMMGMSWMGRYHILA